MHRVVSRSLSTAATLAMFLAAAPAWAEADKATPEQAGATPVVAPTFETSIATTYVFRGIPQYATRSVPSSQSTAAAQLDGVGPGSLSLTVWNATALASPAAQPTTSLEIDVTPQYTMKLYRGLTGAAGYIGYFYPRAAVVDGAHEAFQSLSVVNDIVVPTVTVYEELVRLHGAYASGGLGRTITLGKLELAPQVSAGLVSYRDIPLHVNDLTANASVKWSVTKALYLSVRASESYLPKPSSQLPTADTSAAARFVPSGALAIGFAP